MAKSPYKIPSGAAFHEAADDALKSQARELLKNLDGTMEGDVESLHDMRVASRRLRAAMSVFAAAYPVKRFRPIEKRVSEVTDDLGTVRDADVLLEHLDKVSEEMSEAQRVGVRALADSIRANRENDRQALIHDLTRLKRSGFREDMEELVGGPLQEEDQVG